jgi:hypothetical protein
VKSLIVSLDRVNAGGTKNRSLAIDDNTFGPPITALGRTYLRTRVARRSAAPRIREAANRVPSTPWGPGIKAGSRNSGIVGGLD